MDSSTALDLANLVVLTLTLIFVGWSNLIVAKSVRLNNLQQMVVEMNRIRQARASCPDLERALFGHRAGWTDAEIQSYLVAVQWANILEWAYLARQDGVITASVWQSWAKTWVDVMLASDALRTHLLRDEIWTFGRSRKMRDELKRMIVDRVVPDPYPFPDSDEP